ncbi:hypothetical protein [Glutamicibacter ardleyensis]|uniref:hypothetical protein n=1 Tax=Glutamicibacter ardleyensis TaxID=225894 RepID=UPI003FD5F42F
MQTVKKPSTDIKASAYKPAQDFIHKHNLSQFRMTIYLEALDMLPKRGIMPTDTSIAQFIGEKRTHTAVNVGMKAIVKTGLARKTGDTELGESYVLTAKGERAVLEAKMLINEYYAVLESGEPLPEPPNYQNSFERLNREIKGQRQTIEALNQTIGYQQQIIASLQARLDEV